MFPLRNRKSLFSHINCPEGAACKLPNCVFNHDFFGTRAETDKVPTEHASSADSSHEPKRRKVDSGEQVPIHPESKAFKESAAKTYLKPDRKNEANSENEEPRRSELEAPKGRLHENKASDPDQKKSAIVASEADDGDFSKQLESTRRPISPPPLRGLKDAKPGQESKPKAANGPATKKIQKKEPLAPRALPSIKMPATWAARMKLLTMMHGFLRSLNKQVMESSDADVKALHMNDQALITTALDEEEQLARTGGNMYLDRTRKRCYAFKTMKLDDWVSLRREIRDKELGITKAPEAPKAPPLVETGLSPEEETQFLSHLIANQDELVKYGYISRTPTEAEIASAKDGIETSRGWEKCERCGSRFQVYPDRRDDGSLTSGGKCIHHWGRLRSPQFQKIHRSKGVQPSLYSCCQMPAGADGCATGETHVFKISSPNSLAAVLPFVETPPNPNARKDRAVTFDCEMGYTVNGLELIRLTAVSWPDGGALIDVLVRPLGFILDFNTRFSGVTSEQFFAAKPYTAASDPTAELRIVPDPQTARALLLSHISPRTPLLGHGIENDLNAIRLVHPTIVDTIILFPHPRGLPMRRKLKECAKQHLGWDIQSAGAAGHDSLEDARATGELVRCKVGSEWVKMKAKGWKVRGGKWFGPDGKERLLVSMFGEGVEGRKRKVVETDGEM